MIITNHKENKDRPFIQMKGHLEGNKTFCQICLNYILNLLWDIILKLSYFIIAEISVKITSCLKFKSLLLYYLFMLFLCASNRHLSLVSCLLYSTLVTALLKNCTIYYVLGTQETMVVIF